MSKLLAIFGATGQQGGSVLDHVLNDPVLSQTYKIRAITRDVTSPQAKQLPKDVEVVAGDVNDLDSVAAAVKGVHTAFIVTTPAFGPGAMEAELKTGKAIVDVAVQQGVKYIIFSTLPAVTEISNGKYTTITPFDAKAAIEKYIRSLDVKSAFVAGAWFMQNWHTQPFLGPRPAGDGTWVLSRPIPGSVRMPYIDAVADLGKFVGAILEKPDEFEGKTLLVAEGWYTLDEIAAKLSKSSEKTIVYKECTTDEFRATLPPFLEDMMVDGMAFSKEFGYFGPEGEDQVTWALRQVKGRLTTLDEFLAAKPVTLSE